MACHCKCHTLNPGASTASAREKLRKELVRVLMMLRIKPGLFPWHDYGTRLRNLRALAAIELGEKE